MDDTQVRLMRCFSAVFPKLKNNEILGADAVTVAEWDSISGVTIFAMIEEEFGIEVEVHELVELVSFPKILAYLHSKRAS